MNPQGGLKQDTPGGWLYNRSHLIGHQLTGNDDYENLMTGTRWFNERMLEYESFVANYVATTENHVRYHVTPVFEGNNLLASGAYMEGFSIEDNGEGLMFNIYIPNIQSGVEIDYTDGSSIGPEGPAEEGDVKPYTPPKEESSDKGSVEETPPEPDEYGGQFLPVVRFFVPLFAKEFTTVCGVLYQFIIDHISNPISTHYLNRNGVYKIVDTNFVFCNREVHSYATKSTQCCHPIFSI